LPSNAINDIDISPTTGEVFFATDKGMVSYKGTSTTASTDLSNVNVYPNPVSDELTIKGKGLSAVMIMDQLGRMVYNRKGFTDRLLLNCRQFPSGMYIARLVVNGYVVYRKFVVGR
jgi:hypothetical protein